MSLWRVAPGLNRMRAHCSDDFANGAFRSNINGSSRSRSDGIRLSPCYGTSRRSSLLRPAWSSRPDLEPGSIGPPAAPDAHGKFDVLSCR